VASTPLLEVFEQVLDQQALEKSGNSDSSHTLRDVQAKYFGSLDSDECNDDPAPSGAKHHQVNPAQSESAHEESHVPAHDHASEKGGAAQQPDAHKGDEHGSQREADVNSARNVPEPHAPQESAQTHSPSNMSARSEHAHAHAQAQSNEAAGTSWQIEAPVSTRPVDASAASKPGGFPPEMFTIAEHPQPPHVPTSAHVPQAPGDQSESFVQ
jgi:hypothetical protein